MEVSRGTETTEIGHSVNATKVFGTRHSSTASLEQDGSHEVNLAM
jgi:hypothetical protein